MGLLLAQQVRILFRLRKVPIAPSPLPVLPSTDMLTAAITVSVREQIWTRAQRKPMCDSSSKPLMGGFPGSCSTIYHTLHSTDVDAVAERVRDVTQ